MLSSVVCVALALTLAGGLEAEDKKPDKKAETVKGTIKKVDPSARQLMISIGEKDADRMFDIPVGTKFVFFSSTGKKELTAREAFKNEQLKEGARVEVVADSAGKATEVRVGTPAKKKE